jgi:hypothetical protein
LVDYEREPVRIAMPHAGLMDEGALGPEAGLLQRARLHIRGGKRRLRQGKVSAALVTLYDALIAAMEWYFVSPERTNRLVIKNGDNLRDDKVLYTILVRSGALDGKFDYVAFDNLVGDIIYGKVMDYDSESVVRGIESVMVQLGVMPFNEGELPAEDPSTF